MNKNGIYLIATLISILLLPATSGSLASSVIFATSGAVRYNNSSGVLANKALLMNDYFAYLSSEDRSFAGNHFSLFDIPIDDQATALQEVKKTNPKVKILGYKSLIAAHSPPRGSEDEWTTVNANENWFVHDADGNRITNNQYGFYLMDPSSAGWRQHYINYVNSKFSLPAGSYYDGVFVDDVYRALNNAMYSSTIPSSVLSSWKTSCTGMLQFIKPYLAPGKLLFINSDEMLTDDYLNLDVVDGQMVEGYEHAPWNTVDTYGGGISLDILARKSATNKIIWAASGAILSIDATKNAKMVKYCYTSFLLGMNGMQAYWSFNDWRSGDGSKGYYPIMDVDVGQPVNAYYLSQGVYMRDFATGKVLFNPSAYSYTINLGGTYKLLDGTEVSSVTLEPHSGEILLLVA